MFNDLCQDAVPFRGLGDQGVDLGGRGAKIAGAVDAGFEGAAGGGGGEDGDRVEVEGHGGAVTCVYTILEAWLSAKIKR